MKRLWMPSTLVLALVLAGCASSAGIAPQARMDDTVAAKLKGDPVVVHPQWWRALGDAQLDRLVDQALAGNPSLKMAQARLERARAVLEMADAATLPQVNGSLDITHQRYTEKGLIPPPLAGSVKDNATLQLSGGWEIDFFGKYRSALEAALGSARSAAAEADAAQVILAANVAKAYVQAARVNDQITVAERAVAQREHAVKLVQDRVNAGLDSQLELQQSQAGVPAARQQLEALREQAALARNAVAALVGQPTDDPFQHAPSLAALKPLQPPEAIPANLLGRRADVAAARWRVEAAGYDIDNAKSQFYPNVNLAAFAGLSSIGLGNLLNAGALQWGVGPAVRLPIFEGGKLRANLRGKAADYDAAVASYQGAVVDAVREVADQIASAQSIERQRAQQRLAQQAAETAYRIALQRYEAGLGTYLNVLSAETDVLTQRRLGVDLSSRALETDVNLARALGGGWSDAPVAVAQHS